MSPFGDRLICGTRLELAYEKLTDVFGFGPKDFRRFNRNTAQASFGLTERRAVLAAVDSG